MDWLKHLELGIELYHNPLRDWLAALGIAAATALVARVLKAVVQRRLERSAAAQRSRTLRIIARTVRHTKWFFYLMLAVFLGAKYLELPKVAHEWIRNITIVAVLMQVGVWAHSAIRHAVEHVQSQRAEQGEGAAAMAVAMGFFGRLMVWFIVLMLVLANLGVKITALVAGLGIGGVAAALAVQSVFGDFIASLTIYFDRPFDVGDFVIVGGDPGTVKRVGVRSTRVTSLWGQELIYSNSEMIKQTIHNYARMQERRIHFQFGVVYQTALDKVEKIPAKVKDILEGIEKARFARAHFKSYGDYALVFEVAYYVTTPSYDDYMDVQQRINLELGRYFESEDIEFAYPTTTVHLHQEPAEGGAAAEDRATGST